MDLIKRGKGYIKSEKKDLKDIWRRIRQRDFSGNTGLMVKNSIYKFSTTFVAKIGALIFTIIIARLLMPELFGLYSLALSTIAIFMVFSDLGISSTLIKFISKQLTNKEPNTLAHYNYLLKIKFILTFVASLILILSAYWISNIFYNKPIFYALLAGGLYIFIISFMGFFSSLYYSFNNFKRPLIKESIFQISRLIIVPLIILFSLNFSNEILLLNIILGLSFCYFIALLFLIIKKPVLQGKTFLEKKQKKQIKKFILPLTVVALSAVFFGQIDRIMLGRFVSGEFIGYYAAAFALIGAAIAFLSFSAVLFPIFSRLKGKRLERALKKSIKIILPLSLVLIFITILIAPFVIKIIYGSAYLNSINLLRLLSLLLISETLSAIYTTYFISKGNTKLIAKSFIFTTILNIILNYVLISILVKQSFMLATFGAVIATLISRFVYFGLLIFNRK